MTFMIILYREITHTHTHIYIYIYGSRDGCVSDSIRKAIKNFEMDTLMVEIHGKYIFEF
jgi:hypothetical protein